MADVPENAPANLALIAQRMALVKHKLLVLSGKGGVGKSTVAAQLAYALAAAGKEVGLLDIDICGPSAPKLFGLEGQEVHQSGAGWSPVYVEDNLAVMSIGFLLPNPDDAVIWRGPRKNALIKQFLKDVDWGPLDYLVVDSPPGTSDEHISIAQMLRAGGGGGGGGGDGGGGGFGADGADGALLVTTPQEVALADVRKEASFCRKVGLPLLGVVENMAALAQPLGGVRFLRPAAASAAGAAAAPPPAAGEAMDADAGGGGGGESFPGGEGGEDVTPAVLAALAAAGFAQPERLLAWVQVFNPSGGGAAAMCEALGLRLLGRVPLDPRLGLASEQGRPVYVDGAAGGAAAAAAANGVGGGGGGAEEAPSAAALRAIVARVVGLVEGGGGQAPAG